ncbi:MAG: hypothetical protein JXA04_03475 [Gammaproteobacteria bacterium]|nr:hypothetical protein [Gammaproteobacteria bacterium]
MIEKIKFTAILSALGLTMIVALLTSPIARADENPFSVSDTSSNLVLAADESKCGDSEKAKCGEGKCGDSEEDKCGDSEEEAKCGEGKCGDGE